MLKDSQRLHFDLLIRPESGPGPCPVSLWAARGIGVGQRIFAGPTQSWFVYSRKLEEVRLLDAKSLGLTDACLSRREPSVLPIVCSRETLVHLGLHERLASTSRNVKLSELLNRNERQMPSDSPAQHLQNSAAVHPRFLVPFEKQASSVWQSGQDEDGHLRSNELPLATLPFLESIPASPAVPTAKHMARSSIALLGVRVENLAMDETVTAIDQMIEHGGFHQVATANVDFLTKAFDDRELLDILHDCSLVLPDGMPLVWASRMMGVPLKQRVTGADLLPRLFDLSARKQRRIFLLGATEERSRVALERIERDFPGAVICGRHSPPFAPLDSMDNEAIFEAIERARPDVLLVAFGNPKQEKWIFRNRSRLKVPVCIGVGASIDFFSGQQSRAPMWMQSSGLEWIHRLLSEPRRLAMRYLGDAIFVLRYLSVQLLATALQGKKPEQSTASVLTYQGTPVLRIQGAFSPEMVRGPIEDLERFGQPHSVILDMTGTTSLLPDAAGLLVELAQKCIRQERELWIAGCNAKLRSTLRATFPAGEPFQTALTLADALRFAQPSSVI